MIETTSIGTTMAVEQIDPTQAQHYLEAAAQNRWARQGKIDQYARDMAAGRWHSSVLRFNDKGELVDGQHRLYAVIESETTQLFYVERGLPEAAVKIIDTGLLRTTGDMFAIRGEQNAKTLSAAVRYARWFDKYPGQAPSSQTRVPFSPDEMLEYLDANPDIRDAVRVAKTLIKSLPLSGSLASALIYHEERQDETKAREFWEQMRTGAEMREGSGPYQLRKAIITDRLKPRDDRMKVNVIAALAIKAWNAWAEGRDIRILRWIGQGEAAEKFPTIGG